MPHRGRRLLNAAARNRHRLIAFGGSALAGIVIFFIVPFWLHGATRFAAAYDAAALTLLAMFWKRSLHMDAAVTRARAELDDAGQHIILLVVLVAVIAGLISAIAIIGHGPQVQNAGQKWTAYGLGMIAVTAGWLLVHTVYTFRYAHLFWYDANRDGAPGGITFPGTPDPSDYDFAYFSFCIGTSFAVSDPQVTATRVRREVMGHSIISFAYNSVIVGMVINLFAGIFAAAGPAAK